MKFKLLEKIKKHIDSEYDVKQLRSSGMKIGKNFSFYQSYIDPSFRFLVEVGDNVTLSHASILAHDGSSQLVVKKSKVGKVKIGNNVFIGFQSVVLPNVCIGDNVVIGAGSVVTHDIPGNSIAVGNPCRVIGSYEDFKCKTIEKLKTHPVYPTYHKFKSPEEIRQMQIELDKTFGYDE